MPEPAAKPEPAAEPEPEPEPEAPFPTVEGGRFAPRIRRHLRQFLKLAEEDPAGAAWVERGELAANPPAPAIRHWGRATDPLMVRFSGTVGAPAAAVWDILRDGSRRAELDELFDSSKLLEQMSPIISIWQFDYQSVLLTAPRSFVTLGASVALPDGRLVCLTFSVQHDDASDPEPTGHVRADMGLAGYLITPVSPEACTVTSVLRLHLGGSMMDWICEKAVADQPENLASLAVALLGPKATRSAKDYATWDLPDEVKKAHAALEPLGKALLPKEGDDDGQEEAEDQADWEALLKKPPPEPAAESVVSSMFSKLF